MAEIACLNTNLEVGGETQVFKQKICEIGRKLEENKK